MGQGQERPSRHRCAAGGFQSGAVDGTRRSRGAGGAGASRRPGWARRSPRGRRIRADAPGEGRRAQRPERRGGHRLRIRPRRSGDRWPAPDQCRRTLQGQRHVHGVAHERQEVPQDRSQRVRFQTAVRRRGQDQPPQQRHRRVVDERAPVLCAVSRWRSAGAAHHLRPGAGHRAGCPHQPLPRSVFHRRESRQPLGRGAVRDEEGGHLQAGHTDPVPGSRR